jgi:CRP/FNR family transcriptional regulator, anaerobic regulatory protein
MHLLISHIQDHIKLTDIEAEFIANQIPLKYFDSKTLLLKSGDIATASYFVKSGVLRGYYTDDHLNEHVLQFACERWWIADLYSLLTQSPANLTIEVIEKSEIYILNQNLKEVLYTKIPKLERYFRILTENALIAQQQRILFTMSLTAEERFKLFCKKYPGLIHRVPQKQIASYIGVTPEFFSKMKSKLLREL